MKFLRTTLIAFFATVALSAMGVTPSWEEVKDRQPIASERVENDYINIYSQNGYIYVATSRPIEIKIFSILGQLIKQEKISVGTFRYRIESKGIYIIKAGTVTKRVTI